MKKIAVLRTALGFLEDLMLAVVVAAASGAALFIGIVLPIVILAVMVSVGYMLVHDIYDKNLMALEDKYDPTTF